VKVGAGASTAAGSIITKNVPDGALAVGRVRQKNLEGWAGGLRRRRKDKKGNE
jgi:bifunctional UDP-N-acetylglucosamine pyrophosphorylase / glucosamine-1-phosphate N-acetyltransferase